MKTQCLEASVAAQRSPRIFARNGARLEAPGSAQQLVCFLGEASVISLQNAKELCLHARVIAGKQLAWARKNASSLISKTRASAGTWYVRAWGSTSARLSSTWMEVREQSARASKASFVLISRVCADSIKQSSCAWKRLRAQQIARSNSKRLHVAETVSLGEKRFVAVIKVDGREFLIGGGATNVALLAQLGASKRPNAKTQLSPRKKLDAKKSFDGILIEKMAVSRKQPVKRTGEKAAKPTAKKPGRKS